MKACGLHLSILLFVGVASLPAFADWNFFGNNADYSGYQSNASGTVYVRVEGANIRSAPFVNGSSVFSVLPHNTRLRVIRKDSYSDSGTWYFVSDGRGHTGWVNAHLLSSRPAQSSSAARSSRSRHVVRARASMRASSATASPSAAPAPTSTASPSTVAPAAASSSAATPSTGPQPAVAGWHDPVQKMDSSAFPPPPDFSVNSKAQPASATPSVAKQQPAAATPPPAKPAAAASAKSESPKRVARKAPSKNGCITHYPSQNLPTDASEKQRKEWDQDHEILTEVQQAIHGKILRANYANQLSSMYDITLNFPAESKGRFSSAPIFLNFTGGIRGSKSSTIRSGVVICVKNGVITANLVDKGSGSSNGHLIINGVNGGFSASGIIKTADYGDVQIDETFTRTSR